MMQEPRLNVILHAIHAMIIVCYFLGIGLTRAIARHREVRTHAYRDVIK